MLFIGTQKVIESIFYTTTEAQANELSDNLPDKDMEGFVFSILHTDRADNVGLLLEAMSFHSQNNLVQTYKEIMVKTKLTRDDDSAELLDYVFNGITFDAGMHLIGEINTTIMTNVYLNRKDVLASTIESVRRSFDSALKTISEKIDSVP